VSVAVAGCAGWPAPPEPREVRAEITEEIQAAIAAEVSEFRLPNPRVGEDARIVLTPAEGQAQVSSGDVVNVIAVVGSLIPEERVLKQGERTVLLFRLPGEDRQALTRWDESVG
jgi:hypothetical protein